MYWGCLTMEIEILYFKNNQAKDFEVSLEIQHFF